MGSRVPAPTRQPLLAPCVCVCGSSDVVIQKQQIDPSSVRSSARACMCINGRENGQRGPFFFVPVIKNNKQKRCDDRPNDQTTNILVRTVRAVIMNTRRRFPSGLLTPPYYCIILSRRRLIGLTDEHRARTSDGIQSAPGVDGDFERPGGYRS